MPLAEHTNTTPANLPPPSPELILILALVRALDDKDRRKKPKPGRVPTLEALSAQVRQLVDVPMSLRPAAVPISRAIAGAQAALLALERQVAAG
jgi:hypothetical protein